jgi:HSP20 family protein
MQGAREIRLAATQRPDGSAKITAESSAFSSGLIVSVLFRQRFFHLKTKTMYYSQFAAKGEAYGNRQRPLFIRSMQRAAVNIYKTDNSFEMLVFAPGRIRDHFKIDVEGKELRISYTPPEGFPRPDWVLREYSRGGFVRAFTLDETVDATNISAKYADGVLQVSLPLVPGKETTKTEVPIS